MIIENPKRDQTSRLGTASWFDYYAGYSPHFAKVLIDSVVESDDAVVVDPWNGAGTTTKAAANLGCRSYGFDLNPAMTLVARAKLLHHREKPSLIPLATKIIANTKKKASFALSSDPLSLWMHPKTIKAVRLLEQSLQEILVDHEAYRPMSSRDISSDISDIAAFFYNALFRTVRRLLNSFFGSNPTWVKTANTPADLVAVPSRTLHKFFREEIERMAASFDDDSYCALFGDKSVIQTASSEALPLEDEISDLVVCSPPYCTRIDYAVATLPELATLGYSNQEFRALRESLMGTSAISAGIPHPTEVWGKQCLTFLAKLSAHKSKASGTYYLKNHLQYFASLFKSISEIRRILRQKGLGVIVVQDSYYKDIHNDLPGIVIEMASRNSLELVDRADFPHRRTFAGINPGVKTYRKNVKTVESVLCFKKT